VIRLRSNAAKEDSVHLASIAWERGKWADFSGKYAPEHLWHFAGGAKLKASESPSLTPEGADVVNGVHTNVLRSQIEWYNKLH